MNGFRRFAIYYAPRPGPLAQAAAAWLGYDAPTGAQVEHPFVRGLPHPLAELTQEPRKYGFHATLRAPFRPAEGQDETSITNAVAALAQRLAPARADGLRVVDLHGFLALIPAGEGTSLRALAAAVVQGSNALRAPLNAAEIARRKPDSLTPRQRMHLERWGYPYVMEDFAFHLTLTGRLLPTEGAQVAPIVAAHFAPVLPRPFLIEDLCLFGEAADGRFRLLHRYALAG